MKTKQIYLGEKILFGNYDLRIEVTEGEMAELQANEENQKLDFKERQKRGLEDPNEEWDDSPFGGKIATVDELYVVVSESEFNTRRKIIKKLLNKIFFAHHEEDIRKIIEEMIYERNEEQVRSIS